MIIKKDGSLQNFDETKIINAIEKSAKRCCVNLTEHEKKEVIKRVKDDIDRIGKNVNVSEVHNMVECALEYVNGLVAKSYKEYRNYKKDFSAILDKVWNKKLSLKNADDRSNANADSSLVTTQKAIVYNEMNSLLYDKFFLNDEERKASEEGYIYIHDKGSRLDTTNCFERSTRFITSNGVKSFYDFTEGDEVEVISHKGIWRKAHVIKLPWHKIQRVWFKRGSGDETYVDCTPDHRWILKDGTVTTTLKVGDMLTRTPDITMKGFDSLSLDYGLYSNSGRNNWFVSRIEEIKLNSKANVWCLDVEEDHSFLLEKGIPTGNCSLFDMESVLKGGFLMGNIEYTEPKSLDVAFGVIADVMLNAGSFQYGGLTVCEFDKLISPYAEKSYQNYLKEYKEIKESDGEQVDDQKADKYAYNKVKRDMEQGVQQLECRFNSVNSARGDYPFTSITFGLGTGRWETLFSSTCMKVRKEGQGGKVKVPVLFPKLSFFYDEELHGEGKQLEWLFDEAIDCSSKSMYPDFISLTGDGYQCDIYKKYKTPISRMGCRAQLSPWFIKGGITPEDETDKPVFVGRINLGAIALHFPMIVAKAKEENRDFFEVLEYYMDIVRGIHKKTFEYLSHKKAGINPLGFCQGGFLNGHLDPDQEIGEDFLRPMTISFGVIALNEASVLQTGKSISEDNSFAISILKFMNDYIAKYKKIDNILYALYGVPGESLVIKQVQQFRKKYGIVKDVSDHEYTTNSFHCCVRDDITPIEKQDIEYPMYHLCTGGNIQYCRYPLQYNFDAIKTLVKRGMELGFYEGVNFQLDFCPHCGERFIDSDVCPKCGSSDIIRIERMNGYTGLSKIRGKSFFSDGKLSEFKERVSM